MKFVDVEGPALREAIEKIDGSGGTIVAVVPTALGPEPGSTNGDMLLGRNRLSVLFYTIAYRPKR